MKFLVIGNGGREHAIVWKLNQSPRVTQIYVTDGGNPGINHYAQPLSIGKNDYDQIIETVRRERIDYTIVGPEDPLAGGIVDRFLREGLKIFGPTMKAAQLESSKVFAKNFMRRHGIPTAQYETFDDYHSALNYLRRLGAPCVVKADGLAAGKGAIVCPTLQDAESALARLMQDKELGNAGSKVVIEEFMRGQELSVLAISDGKSIQALCPAQDHKQVFDGDLGPNTGGMGAYAPVPFVDQALMKRVYVEILQPTIDAMNAEGSPYSGVLYAGLMITREGPRVIEFNCRLGDPETQVALPLLKSDWAETVAAVCDGELARFPLVCDSQRSALVVIMASQGYPGHYEKGFPIDGLDGWDRPDLILFHAGTRLNDQKQIVTHGGRVMGLTAIADTLPQAYQLAYSHISCIRFQGMFYRSDISKRVW